MEIAQALGLDLARFGACLSSREPDARLRSDISLGMREGVTGLPTYIVDGRRYTGALPPELAPPGSAGAAAAPGASAR